MSKYIIISKDKPRNKQGEQYEICYTLRSNPTERLYTTLMCISSVPPYRYCYIAGKETPCINTPMERSEFIEEFYKYQKGGSYRRANPIVKTELEQLYDKCSSLEEELANVKDNIKKQEYKNKQDKLNKLLKQVDTKSLNKFTDKLSSVLLDYTDKYTLEYSYSFLGNKVFYIMDLDLKVPVKILTIKRNTICFDTPTVEDIKKYL